ncbi:glycosyltransferase [Tenacibaculum ascidiaceicola]|uniref:glycosyltransferase family 2 protein n=1 Tax=Tenacibaculum ascidiaceicola TaxID=1699411 RepID=UPI003CE58603
MNKISIIIPHFNSEITLKKLLYSIPQENWIEVIVIDDNSDNDIFNLEEEFNKVLFFKVPREKKGAGSARNIGLENATGNYLLFADADDYFLEGAFSVLKKSIEKKFDIMFFEPISFDTQLCETGKRHLAYSSIIKDYMKTNKKEVFFKFYVPWSKLISSKLIKNNKIKFDEVIASNDVLFSLKSVYYASDIVCVEDQIYCVTESSNSLTKQISEEVLDSRFEAMSRYNDFLKDKNLKKLQGAMSGHLWNTRYFGVYKFLYRYFYCRYKGYPIFYDLKHIIRAFRHLK